jgi:hypothetical protein
MDYGRYSVSASRKRPLLEFILSGLSEAGCNVVRCSNTSEAPFRISFEDPSGQRHGILVYAFFANSKLTKNRPTDEHRFQIKYGKKDGLLHRIWQDPYGLYTTLMVGIDTEREIFVGIDPVLHEYTKFFISVEFKSDDVSAILQKGWHCWERNRRKDDNAPVETMVGGKQGSFLDFVRFEQAARGLDQGHRFLLAEKFDEFQRRPQARDVDRDRESTEQSGLHALATEFAVCEEEILNMIQAAPRLKMAVRGWVAEHHLGELLKNTAGVDSFCPIEEDGRPDFEVIYRGSRPILIECKNALRRTLADGSVRVDFQKTRASKSDPCSRFYRPEDFQILAACLHPCTERWEFAYRLTNEMNLHIGKCAGHLNNNVRITDDWDLDIATAFERLLA